MTFNDSAQFQLENSKEFDESNGQRIPGEIIELTGIEIHPLKDNSVDGSGGGRAMARVRVSRGQELPQNAIMLWRGYKWTPIKDAAYHAQILDSQRHWRSMRYISQGRINDN